MYWHWNIYIFPKLLRKSFKAIPHSAFRTPYSALRIPHSAFRTLYSAFRTPHSVLRIPYSVFRNPYIFAA